MPLTDRLIITAELQDLAVRYWQDVDFNWGRNAHMYFTEDGVFHTTKHHFAGREAIRKFYAWREGRGDRLARHIVNNMCVTSHDNSHASVRWIMSLYAADGLPVQESNPPIMMADMIEDCIRTGDGEWLYQSRTINPVFRGGVPVTSPSEEEAKQMTG